MEPMKDVLMTENFESKVTVYFNTEIKKVR
jgi:hypothetical protein